jgi:hypothetical protein
MKNEETYKYLNKLAVDHFNKYWNVKQIVYTAKVKRSVTIHTDVGLVEFRPKQ